jgi:hypothetical protein
VRLYTINKSHWSGKTAVGATFWSILAVCGAVRVLHHQLPYKDFNTGYAPAQFYTVAAVFKAFGASLLTGRIWDLVWRALRQRETDSHRDMALRIYSYRLFRRMVRASEAGHGDSGSAVVLRRGEAN